VHQGLRELLSWVNSHRDDPAVRLLPPATSGELTELEQELGQTLPSDLRHVLGYFNGGKLPIAELLPGGVGPGTIGGATKSYAAHIGRDFLDPELLLPFAKTDEESLLAFDRSAGPVADTWPIVDYHPQTGFHRLVYRTIDGFCRHAVAEWSSPDFGREFTLDVYLRKGQRHIEAEPDVAAAHAALAHAERRAGLVERAISSYLTAGRCTPPEPWCDFEALKLAVLVGDLPSAIEAGTRLVQPSPEERWSQRETTPGRVAEALGVLAARANARTVVLRLLERLKASAGDELPVVSAVASAVSKGEAVVTRPVSETPVVPPSPDRNVYAQRLTDAYVSGHLRDEHMLFEPGLGPLRDAGWFGQLLHVRRDF
jgi:hypothetical protein